MQVSFLSLTSTEKLILPKIWRDVFCWLDVNKNYVLVDVVIVAELLRPCCHWKIHSGFIIPTVINTECSSWSTKSFSLTHISQDTTFHLVILVRP